MSAEKTTEDLLRDKMAAARARVEEIKAGTAAEREERERLGGQISELQARVDQLTAVIRADDEEMAQLKAEIAACADGLNSIRMSKG